MKLKSFLKVGLPLVGVAALSISLPLALTSCSSTSDDEVNATKESVTNGITKIAELTATKIGEKQVTNFDSIKDQIQDTMKIGSNTIKSIDMKYNTVQALTDEAEDAKPAGTNFNWTITITLKEGNTFGNDLYQKPSQEQEKKEAAPQEQEESYTIGKNGNTLTLTIKDASFNTVGVSNDVNAAQQMLNKVLNNMPVQASVGTEEYSATNTEGTQINTEGTQINVETFKKEMLDFTNDFIPSSIAQVTYESDAAQAPAAFFSLPSTRGTESEKLVQVHDDKLKVTIKLNDEFTFVEKDSKDNKDVTKQEKTFTNIVYNEKDVNFTQALQQKMLKVLNAKLANISKATDLNDALKQSIRSELSQDATTKDFYNLLEDILFEVEKSDAKGDVATEDTPAKTSTVTITLIFKPTTDITVQGTSRDNQVEAPATGKVANGSTKNILVVSGIPTKIVETQTDGTGSESGSTGDAGANA